VLDGEFALEQGHADVEELTKPAADLRLVKQRRPVDVDRRRCFDDLADPSGEMARGNLPFPAEPDLLAPQPGDDDRLDHHDGESDHPQPDALDEYEGEGGQRLRSEEYRLDERVADEAADRLDLVVDHAGRFGRLDR